MREREREECRGVFSIDFAVFCFCFFSLIRAFVFPHPCFYPTILQPLPLPFFRLSISAAFFIYSSFFFFEKKKMLRTLSKETKKRKEKKSELFKKKKKVSSGSVSFDLFCVSSAFSFSYPASSRDVGLFCCSFSLSSRYKKSDDEQKKDKKSSNLFVFFSFTCSPSRCRCGCRRSRSRPRCRRLRPSLLASERRLRP